VQAVYDSCVKDNIGLDRPHWGYHCLPKIHHTDRPKPIEEKPAWMDNPKVSVPYIKGLGHEEEIKCFDKI
jgi:hypothetical protein